MQIQTIGQRIWYLRITNHMTQDALAKRLYVSGNTISSWEHGRTEPNLETIVKLSELFGVSLLYLITGESTL